MSFPTHVVRAGKTYINGVEVKHTGPAKKVAAVKPVDHAAAGAPKKKVARESITAEPSTTVSVNGYVQPNGSPAFQVF